MNAEPIKGATYGLRSTFRGVAYTDYQKVIDVSGTRRRSVYLIRCGTGRASRIGMREFQRRARPSPGRRP